MTEIADINMQVHIWFIAQSSPSSHWLTAALLTGTLVSASIPHDSQYGQVFLVSSQSLINVSDKQWSHDEFNLLKHKKLIDQGQKTTFSTFHTLVLRKQRVCYNIWGTQYKHIVPLDAHLSQTWNQAFKSIEFRSSWTIDINHRCSHWNHLVKYNNHLLLLSVLQCYPQELFTHHRSFLMHLIQFMYQVP